MATEGIMALPQGTGMPGEEPQNQPLAVTSADSYDAAQTALGMTDPGAQEAIKAAIRESLADEQLSPQELQTFIITFEELSQDPAGYKAARQQLIDNDYVDPEDLPEEYDPEFLGAVLAVLNEMQLMQGQGAMEPMQMSPTVESLAPIGMAEGGLADVASYLAAQGRNGDSILAHITPKEASLLKRRGGSGTINPVTGLPEFFLKKLFKGIGNAVKKVLKSPVGRILGTIALATVLGPAGVGLSLGSTAATSAAINFGLASAGTTLLGGGSVKEALISGAMGYFGGGGTAFGVNPMSAIGQYLPGAAGSALNTGLASGVLGAGIGKLSGMSTRDALKMGLTSGATAAAMTGLRGTGLDMSSEQRAARDAQFRGEYAAAGGGGSVAPGGVGTAQDLLAGPGGSVPADYQADFYRSIGIDPASVSGPSASPMTNAQIEQGILGLPGGPAAPAAPAAPTAPATPAGYQDEFYRSIGIDPASVSGPSATGGPSNVQIERDMLGMRGFGDTASQLKRDPMSVAKGVYNEYLSPSRPGLPADASFFRKYGPLTLAGTGIMAAAGGMKGSPSNPNPVFNRDYTGFDYMRDNPQMFQGGLDFSYQRPTTPQSPVVQTDFSRAIPLGAPAQFSPMGVTTSPAGVAQPYNVGGMYGIPLVYPVNRAKGGEMSMTQFPRKTGPIDGPGTGTSDSIPAMLSDGEFVFTAKAVRNAGGGSRRKGAARMYKLMKKLEGGSVKG
jgi:hypothetical protein